jgi:polysaccharide export outer membrane protein
MIGIWMSEYRSRRPNRALSALCAVSLLSGCSTLPNAGPKTADILDAAQPAPEPGFVAPYDVVPITDSVVAALEHHPIGGLAGSFGGVIGGRSEALGVGDVVGISIYEASSGGLFGSGDIGTGVGTKNVQLPPQQIDQAGYISVPFAGRVRASGRTTAQVGASIRAALAAKAIDPQVIVTLNQNAANLVTVSGEVGQGGRFPISLRGDRVLDAIASAGGPRAGAHEIYVRLTRGGRSGVVRLSALVARPQENVSVRAGDDIFLYRKPDTFTVLGASAANNTISFDQSRLSLVEAIGKARGLDDNRADAAGVFLFRYEDPRVYSALRLSSGRGGFVPVVYHLDLKNPQSLLLAQRVEMRDKDVIYVSNAASGDAMKLFHLIGASVGIVGAGVTLSRVGN